MAFGRVLLLNISGSSGAASTLTVVLLPSASAEPGIRERQGYRFALDLMRALMRIPPGVSNDVCANDSASGSTFFDRFGEGVLSAIVWSKKIIFK